MLRCVDDSGANKELYALDRSAWREVRRIQGKNKGKPYVLPENCVIRLPAIYKNRQLRIFVENEEDVDGNYTDVSTEEISD